MLGHNVLVISDSIAGCAPVLALLHERHWRPVLLSDADQAASAIAEDTNVELVVLAGSLHFCEPCLQSFTQFRYSRHIPPLLVISADGSEAFAVAALRAGANDYFSEDRKSTRLNSSHVAISYAVFCLKKKKIKLEML